MVFFGKNHIFAEINLIWRIIILKYNETLTTLLYGQKTHLYLTFLSEFIFQCFHKSLFEIS